MDFMGPEVKETHGKDMEKTHPSTHPSYSSSAFYEGKADIHSDSLSFVSISRTKGTRSGDGSCQLL